MSTDELLGLVYVGRGGQRWQVTAFSRVAGVRIDAGNGLKFWLETRTFNAFIDKGALVEEAAATVPEPSDVLTESERVS